MATELTLKIGTLYAFLLVLTRIAGIFVFVPLPGMQAGPQTARVLMATVVTLALFPAWPLIPSVGVSVGTMIGWIAAEAGLGIAVGVAVSFLSEMFQMGAQIIGLQAGYSFASTVDPTSGADTGVLISIAQTCAGLLFFATGLDRQILSAFAQSLITHPPGQISLTASMMNQLIQTSSLIFSTGLRIELPLLALLIMVDVAMALLARLNSQLQLITLTFPIKMLVSLALLGWLVLIFPRVFTQSSGQILRLVRGLLLG
jgi:flagellar biosynthetic protein FliR